jgi:dienelactone hydrolase
MTLRPAGYRRYAADLAKHGYSAFLVHYFDRTSEEKLGKNYGPKLELWLSTIHDAIGFVAQGLESRSQAYRSGGILPQRRSRAGSSCPRSTNQSD